jgi:hypothetical protein
LSGRSNRLLLSLKKPGTKNNIPKASKRKLVHTYNGIEISSKKYATIDHSKNPTKTIAGAVSLVIIFILYPPVIVLDQ